MNRRYNKSIQRIMLLFSAWTLMILTAGCDQIRLFPAEKPIPENDFQDQSVLEEGFRRYETGDFENAAVLFGQLRNDAENPAIRQRALYGLACSRLILAEDDAEMDEAIRLWNTWSQSGPEHLTDQDPRMLAPLVHRIVINGFVEPQIAFARPEETPSASEPSDDDVSVPSETEEVVVPYEPESAVSEDADDICEIRLEDREKRIREMEKKLNTMKRRIRTLKKQIDSLETIHREIQKKKKEFYYQ